VSLEHLLLSRYPSQSESIKGVSRSISRIRGREMEDERAFNDGLKDPRASNDGCKGVP
jgi:hypothetical protein